MRKIPTLFKRDPENMARVLREVHPNCEWVLAGEGTATRKYDGTCVMFDGARWWGRREVKEDRPPPPGFVLLEHDNFTGKSIGWEPAEQSSFAKYINEARNTLIPDHTHHDWSGATPGATYELIGPKINGNPEKCNDHILVRHGYMSWQDIEDFNDLPLNFDGLMTWLIKHKQFEGVVWHHSDGRMAKLKRRDAVATVGELV